jgi:hypothetical protein
LLDLVEEPFNQVPRAIQIRAKETAMKVAATESGERRHVIEIALALLLVLLLLAATWGFTGMFIGATTLAIKWTMLQA